MGAVARQALEEHTAGCAACRRRLAQLNPRGRGEMPAPADAREPLTILIPSQSPQPARTPPPADTPAPFAERQEVTPPASTGGPEGPAMGPQRTQDFAPEPD